MLKLLPRPVELRSQFIFVWDCFCQGTTFNPNSDCAGGSGAVAGGVTLGAFIFLDVVVSGGSAFLVVASGGVGAGGGGC